MSVSADARFLPEAEPAPTSPLRLRAGYALGTSALVADRFEHAATLQLDRPLLGGSVSLSLLLAAGYADLHGLRGDSTARVTVLPGLQLRTPLLRRLALTAAAELGWSALFVGGERPSRDWFVPTGRLQLGLELDVVAGVSICGFAGPALYLVTVGTREELNARPQIGLAVSFQP